MNCFGDLNLQRVCVNCTKKSDDTPSLPHHLPQRTVLNNRYLVSKALGEGGFGITYLAWDLTQGTKCAIKEYYPSGYVNRVPKSNQVIINSKQNQAASNRGLKRFIDEAKILARIKNLPGIVSVKDFFSANGTAYIVMEFLDGISLKKYMQRKGGRITTDEVLTILRPVMESLIHVHDMNLIHRDISPDNILITKYNEVKLIDFGAAKQSNLDGKSLSIVLKQGFAPEEQYRTHGEQGPWTDIYALGVSIYYCITGKLPPESIQRMYKDAIVKPSEHKAVISHAQENALMKSLAVFSKNRYQDMDQMIKGLYGVRSIKTASATTQPKGIVSITPTPIRGTSIPVPSSKDALASQRMATPTITRPSQNTTLGHANPSISHSISRPNTIPTRPFATTAPQAKPTSAYPSTRSQERDTIPKTLDERRREIAENRARRLAEKDKNS